MHPLPENHRFPMEKYALLPEQLKHEGSYAEEHFFSPTPIPEDDLLAVHDLAYWKKLSTLSLNRKEELRSGFPLSKQLIDRELVIMGGSLQAALYALEGGLAYNIAGGTHHAYTDRAEGFCLLNDIAITASHLLRNAYVKQVLVVDLDVHQGNGTAKIFEGDKRVFTFSMHGAKNYPMHKEQSDLDVGLPDGIEGEAYLALLNKNLPKLIDQVQPDFIIYQCGVDIIAGDKLGRLGVSIEDCKGRDEIVLNLAHTHQIPLMACMGGGYSPDIKNIIEAHANTYRLGRDIFG